MTTEDERQAVVDAACEAILARGDRPTVDRVRDHLGGGSPNKLTPLVRAWKARQRTGVGMPPPPSLDTEPGPVETPAAARPAVDALSNAVEALRGALDGLPRAFVQVAAMAGETERRRSDLEVQSIKAAADAQVREAAAETADERGTVELLRQEVDAKDAEVTSLAAQSAAASAEAEKFRTALGEESSRAVELGAALERATARIAELDGLLESARCEAAAAGAAAEGMRVEARDLNAKREALQAELAEARTGIAVAQQAARSAEAAARAGDEARDAAVQQARADAERAGAAEARARAVEDQAKKLEADLERFRNAKPSTPAVGVSPASGDVAARQERTGKRGGAGVEASV